MVMRTGIGERGEVAMGTMDGTAMMLTMILTTILTMGQMPSTALLLGREACAATDATAAKTATAVKHCQQCQEGEEGARGAREAIELQAAS